MLQTYHWAGYLGAVVENGVLQVNSGLFSPLSNITDGNTANYASNQTIAGVISNTGVSVLSEQTFPNGWRAGFVVEFTGGLLSADVLGAITLQTLNNGTVVDTKTSATGLGVTLLGGGTSNKLYLNFASNGAFNEVRFLLNNTLSINVAANSLRVYHAMAFDPACGTVDNNGVCDDQIAGNQTVVNFNPGLLNALATLANPGNITDGDKKTAATLVLPAGVGLVSSPPFVGVKSLQTIYPTGGQVGFVIQQVASLLSVNVLINLRIQTFLHGEKQQDIALDDNTALIGIAALGGTNPVQKVSIPTTLPYNEVRLVVAQTASVNVGSLLIYYAFESVASCTDCQDILADGGAYPSTDVVDARTGGSACLGLGSARVDDEALVVNNNITDFGRIRPPFLGVGCEGSISVRTAAAAGRPVIPANAFVGFVVSTNGNLLDLGVLGGLRIRTYLNGNPRDDSDASGISLVGLSVLSGGTGLTKVGIKTTQAFDEIRITVDFGLLGTFVTSDEVRVYYAFVQRDDDNDGVLDCNEVCKAPLNTGDDSVDSDGDGTPDACEACNAINNKSASIDTDGDGLFNNCDPDSDNDGIPDTIEDTNGDGDPNNDDQDGDGVPNYLDLDSDNDGILDLYESGLTTAQISANDSDGNGVLNGQNPVAVTTPRDTDRDGVPDYLDLDSDNDGIRDLTESGFTGLTDANNDGVVDGPDADNDGIQDSADSNDGAFGSTGVTAPRDTDGDGAPNFRDLDSDNDGIKDLTESGRPDLGTLDANNDGVVDGPDADNDGIQDSVDSNDLAFGSPGTGTPIDSDGDNVPDVRDLDSDNDGINDIVENGNSDVVDANGDGQVDGPDNDKDGILGGADTNDGVFGSPGSPVPVNSDNDPLPNFQDLDSDNDSVGDLAESGQTGYTDSPEDGVVDGPDTDGDGIQDSVDGAPNTFGDANSPAPKNTDNADTPDYIDTDSNNDGTKDIVSNGKGGLDGNGDGMVDNPTDPDNDGIANNGGLDQKPTEFGGLGPVAGLPDLTPSVFSDAGTYNQNQQRELVVALFNISTNATTAPVEFEINKVTPGFTISINPNATSSTVIGQPLVANGDWIITEQANRYVLRLKDGLSMPANGNKKIVIQANATGSPNAAATLTVRIFNGTGGGETPTTNNSAVYLISINDLSNN